MAKVILREPVDVIRWWPGGDEIENVTEVRHTQLGFIGHLQQDGNTLMVKPGDYVLSFLGKQIIMNEEIFKINFKGHKE